MGFIKVHFGQPKDIFTDIGAPCAHVISQFKQCHAIFLETNYDEEMLENGHYPLHLKKRISGKRGHLSNQQALELFKGHQPAFMRLVLLSHLSRDNNDPALVQELFTSFAGGTEIVVASRYTESPVFTVTAEPGDPRPQTVCIAPEKVKPKSSRTAKADPLQLVLDF